VASDIRGHRFFAASPAGLTHSAAARADTGLTVPAGLYLIRVTATSEEGGQSSALATVALR
jgi:hypothetical protein